MNRKEQPIQKDFIWGVAPEGLFQITRTEYKTQQYKNKKTWSGYSRNIIYRHNNQKTQSKNSGDD